jgi:hypothetical protein
MPTPVEQPSYPRCRDAVDRVIAAAKVRDRERLGTRTWDVANTEHQAALATYGMAAGQVVASDGGLFDLIRLLKGQR